MPAGANSLPHTRAVGTPVTSKIEIYQTNPFLAPSTPFPILFSIRYARLLPSARSHHKPIFCYPKFPGGVPMRTISLCLIAVAAHAATTVYQASVDQLTVVHGTVAADSAIHHTAPKSLRVEPGGQYPDALVRSAPVALTIGKRYELSAWVRTENLTVRD